MDSKQQKLTDDQGTETLLERAVRQSLKRLEYEEAETSQSPHENDVDVTHEDHGISVH